MKCLLSDCTHYTWTIYNEGTCWMKQNTVSASDAHHSYDKSAVCGIVDNVSHIAWNGNDWAFECDFEGNDLADEKTSSHECYNRCASTEGMYLYVFSKSSKYFEESYEQLSNLI